MTDQPVRVAARKPWQTTAMWFKWRPVSGTESQIDRRTPRVISWGLLNRAPSRAQEGTRTLSTLRNQLIQIVHDKGLDSFDEPVQLASGAMSTDFVDGKRALANGNDLRTACEALIELVSEQGIEFDAVGGLTLGADQFAHGVAMLTGLDWFVVRKAPKGRGTNRRIEGADLREGTRVLLVDDVVTSGGSIREAYQVLRDETRATVVAAVTLVDRGGHADEFFKAQRVFYAPLVTYRDLGIEPVDGGLINA
jgi:orotate phosphoribosyltransferase